MMYTPEALEQYSREFQLVGGGYQFENPEHTELSEVRAMTWPDPDIDYLWVDDRFYSEQYEHDAIMYAFIPLQCLESLDADFPEQFEDPDGGTWTRAQCEWLPVGELECPDCYDSEDPPKACELCDLDGHYMTTGGRFAVYVLDCEED